MPIWSTPSCLSKTNILPRPPVAPVTLIIIVSGRWSAHAYAQLSPVFNAMQATITKLTDGSNGDFCIRCHTQVGMNLGESTYMSNMDRHPTSREGITCIVCHRLQNDYGKVSGRFALVTGDILTPVYGPTGDAELKRVLSQPDVYPRRHQQGGGRPKDSYGYQQIRGLEDVGFLRLLSRCDADEWFSPGRSFQFL